MRTVGCIRTILLGLLSGLLFQSCYKEAGIGDDDPRDSGNPVIEFDQVALFADLQEHLLLYPLSSDTIRSFNPHVRWNAFETVEFEGMSLKEGERNELGDVMINHPYRVSVQEGKRSETYTLYFTGLPLVHILTDSEIRDEPKVASALRIAFVSDQGGVRETHLFTSDAGIEIRGRTSAAYEKKSYGLELWRNSMGDDRTVSLLGMRYGEDWILDAMYVDPLRMRNKLCFELWEKMWQNREELPFHTTRPGIQCEFVELFINRRYQGLYCLTERLDEHLLSLAQGEAGAEGVLYKAIDWSGGATAFKTYNSEPGTLFTWEGWEQIFPDHRVCWEPLAELTHSVVFDADDLFDERITGLLNLEEAAEYYLFANLILAHDNIIKNYFLARYPDQTRFLILPWDLEGSLGIMWDGEPSSCGGFLENNLFKRLMEQNVDEFNGFMKERWEFYRESLFRADSLLEPARAYSRLLIESGAIDRENRRWPDAETDLNRELDYLTDWTMQRLSHLDRVYMSYPFHGDRD